MNAQAKISPDIERNETRGATRTPRSRAEGAAPPSTHESLAAQALELANGDIETAAEHHYRLFTANRDTMQEKLPEIVQSWCRHQVLMHLVASRRAIFYPKSTAPEQNGARLRQARSMYLDFPLPVTGKPLREATQADLALAVGYYQERIKDADAKAKWLGLIADRIGNRLVGEALSEADLATLREKIDA